MAYAISTAFAIYFVLWWLVLFLTLPFGVRSQHEDGEGAPGTDPGAPVLTRMGLKLIWTTIISAVIFTLPMWAHSPGHLNIERLSQLLGDPVFALPPPPRPPRSPPPPPSLLPPPL